MRLRTIGKALVLAMAMSGIIATLGLAQTAQKPQFEVASIKANTGGNPLFAVGPLQPGGRFTIIGADLKAIMGFAFHGRIQDSQLVGGPGWLDTLRWDIDAKMPEGMIPPEGPRAPAARQTVQLMLQSLLEDRFQLKWHRETRDLPIYELVVSKGGAKLKTSEGQASPSLPLNFVPGQPPPPGNIRNGRGNIEGTAVAMSGLISALSQQLGRLIIDKTGLQGLYDFTLRWTPDLAASASQGTVRPAAPGDEPVRQVDPNGPSVFLAIQEQLGLRLESTRGQVEVVVIDSVERPTEN